MDDFEDECNSNDGTGWHQHHTHQQQHQSYTSWEQECMQQMEELPDLEAQVDVEKASSAHKLWISFQTAACCVAQLYKGLTIITLTLDSFLQPLLF